ncbi:MAG: methyltransferase [Patescibacteria group bacterium]
MKAENITQQPESENPHKNRVHRILAHSYLFYFISFLLGLFLDFMFPVEFYEKITMASIGAVFLILGTFLILWAQMSSHKLKKENMSKETFCCGPYRYTRSPTHFGLFFLMLGFGIMTSTLFIIIFSVISFIITKFTFIQKEEKILAEKYGAPYLEYKKSVKF